MTRRRSVLTALASLITLAAGCGVGVGEPEQWRPWQDIDGPLAPEIGAPPVLRRALVSPEAADTVRVVTYNCETGAELDGIATTLAEHPALAGADVLLLQELESYPEEGSSRAFQLATRLGLYYAYVPSRVKRNGTHGIAILSAHPIESVSVMMLPQTDVPISGAPRVAAEADIRIGERLLHVVDVHLDTTLNIGERVIQLRPSVIDQPDQVVVAGDFNTNDYAWAGNVVPLLPLGSAVDTEQAPQLDDFMRRLGYTTPTADFGPTERKLGVESRLDSIYVRGLTTGAGAVIRTGVSDHWPIWLDISLAP